MRIRQIVFAANDLEPTLARLCTMLDGPVVFRDPGVAHFGLENGLLVSGGDFIEVVSPLPNKTCLLYTSPSPRDGLLSRMPSSA